MVLVYWRSVVPRTERHCTEYVSQSRCLVMTVAPNEVRARYHQCAVVVGADRA